MRPAAALPLVALVSALAACPPVRENIDGAGAGYAEEAFFVWRESPYGSSPLWAMVFVPRDEDHDCNAMLSYDWSDADQDYARFNLSLARGLQWEGEFANSYLGCGNWYDADRRCFDGFDWDEGEYTLFDADSTMTIDDHSSEQVRGVAVRGDGERISFRATNCGEMPYYYWIGDAEPGEPSPRASRRDRRWGLRFR